MPFTALCSREPYDIGSHQEWVDAIGALAVGDYSVEDQQRMAVIDYVIAHSDRGPGNLLTSAGGRPVAIDKGDNRMSSGACWDGAIIGGTSIVRGKR